MLLVSTMSAACVQTSHSGRGARVRGAVVRAVATMLLMFLVFLVLFLVVVLVAQHVRADRSCDEPSNSAQRTAAHLVAQERAASASYER